RWSLGRVKRVTVRGSAEAGRLRARGVPEDRIVQLPPAVADARDLEFLPKLGLPAGSRLLVVVGPLERSKGFREAIWAFDLLRHPHGELPLLLIGGGPDRRRLEGFARATQVPGCGH